MATVATVQCFARAPSLRNAWDSWACVPCLHNET